MATRTALEIPRSAPASLLADSARFTPAVLAEPQVVRGIVFDMADVLYDATPWRRWLWRLLGQLGVRVAYAEFCRRWDDEYLLDVYRGRREYHEAFQSFLLATGLSWAQCDEVEAASRIQRQNLELNVRPLPGVVKTIARLRELGLPLAAWGDSQLTAARLSERLERLALGDRFQAVLSSFDLECAQPAPECYQSALNALRLSAPQTVYIGHDALHLMAAKAVGMRTVAFNYDQPPSADAHLTRIEDLVSLIEQWAGLPPTTGSESAASAWRNGSAGTCR